MTQTVSAFFITFFLIKYKNLRQKNICNVFAFEKSSATRSLNRKTRYITFSELHAQFAIFLKRKVRHEYHTGLEGFEVV